MAKTKEGYGQATWVPFWEHYDIIDGECWIWRGGKNRQGQGVVRHEGKNWVTSRLAWILSFGEIPPKIYVCHTCDNPSCINPNHLFLGTPKDNTQDMIRKGRRRPERPKLKIWAECHPDRAYLAKGLCYPCYHKRRRDAKNT
jgi:hypothetical protein